MIEVVPAQTGGEDLGGRLPLLAPEHLSGEQRVLYDRLEKKQLPWATEAGFRMQNRDGSVIGPFNALLRTPDISGPFMDWTEAQSRSSALSEEVRQVVVLTVGAHWGSAYELYAHTAVGRSEGLSADAIEAIKAHEAPKGVSEAAFAAYGLVDVLLCTHRVPDDVYAEAAASLTVHGIVAVLHLVGQYASVCGMLNVFDVPAPQAG